MGKHAAGRLVSEITTNGIRLKLMQVFILANKHSYALTVGGPSQKYNEHFAEQVVASFEIP